LVFDISSKSKSGVKLAVWLKFYILSAIFTENDGLQPFFLSRLESIRHIVGYFDLYL